MKIVAFKAAVCAAAMAAGTAAAATPQEMISSWERSARSADARFAGFSAARGEAFFTAAHGAEWSCASCHTARPAQPGEHARTHKAIAPLAPAGDPRRFTDPAKVDKWFGRNCNDVLGRACTLQERGDVLAYLMSVKGAVR